VPLRKTELKIGELSFDAKVFSSQTSTSINTHSCTCVR